MKKTNNNLMLLRILAITSLIIGNVLVCMGSVTFFTLPIMGGIEVSTSPGLFTYPMVFLCTDVISQIWGKKESQRTVWYGFFAQLLSTAIIILPKYFCPIFGVTPHFTQGYEDISAISIVTVASMTAYLLAQTWDVFAFHKLMDWGKKVFGEKFTRNRWIWNNGSTLTSQLIDTFVFDVIAFYFGFGWSALQVVGLAIGVYCWKAMWALIDTPFFYLLTRGVKTNPESKLIEA